MKHAINYTFFFHKFFFIPSCFRICTALVAAVLPLALASYPNVASSQTTDPAAALQTHGGDTGDGHGAIFAPFRDDDGGT